MWCACDSSGSEVRFGAAVGFRLLMLERGREACRQRAWLDAHASLTEADEAEPLGPDDLELLATAAYMLGRDDEWVAVHERAHRLRLEASEIEGAAHNAFWIGFSFAL